MDFPYPYPLWLPKGSVRATLTILLSTNLIWLTVQESTYAQSFSTMVAVSLTFYFGGRMRGSYLIPRNSAAHRAWGLPAGTIRTMLSVMFLGLTIWVFSVRGTVPDHLRDLLNIMLGYALGKTFNTVKLYLFHRDKTGDDETLRINWVDHLKAALIMVFAIFLTYSVFTDFSGLSERYIPWLIAAGSILMGFYFGERN